MIIDIHTHTFPEHIAARALAALQANCHTALFSDGTEASLRACEARAGVDLAVVQPVATYPDQVSRINKAVLARPPRLRDGVLSFGAMHPACPVWEAELEQLAAAGVPGIKLHTPFAEVDMDDPRTVAVLKKCRGLGLLVLIHSGWDIGLPGRAEALPAKIRRAMDAAGPVRLIAGHMGGWRCWEEAARLLPETGVCLDTSFSLGTLTPAPDDPPRKREDLEMLSPSDFCALIDAFGADHVLFGTDSPWADPAAELRALRALPLPKADLTAILGENARALLGL